MLSLNTSCTCYGVSTATRAFQFRFRTSPSLFFFSPTKNFKFRSGIARAVSGFSDESNSTGEPKLNYAGVRLEEIVDDGIKSGKLRLDSWISSRINGISRARVQSSIKAGLVHVNGRVVDKVSFNVRAGDEIKCTIAELQQLRAVPENIPLDIVFEDEHLLVINKPAHMASTLKRYPAQLSLTTWMCFIVTRFSFNFPYKNRAGKNISQGVEN